MDANENTLSIAEGMDVVGSDGEKLGSVDRVEGNYVIAKKGWFFPKDYFIPSEAISSVDGDTVVLNVTRDAVLQQGWDDAPIDREVSDSETREAMTTNSGTLPYDSAAPVGRGLDNPAPFDHSSTNEAAHEDDRDGLRVPLAEEELTATTRAVDRGQVRIDKDVVSEEQTLDVPVTEERVNVTRRVVDRNVSAGDAAFEDDTIDIPVHGEEVDLQKQARVVEEIDISRESVTENQQVSGTVRKERARISDTTGTGADEEDDTRR